MASESDPGTKHACIREAPAPGWREIAKPIRCASCPVRDYGLFREVPDTELTWKERYRKAQYAVKARTLIYEQGECTPCAFTVLSGWIKAFKVTAQGKTQILRFALPGDFIGIQLNLRGPMTHGARALTDSTLCAFSRVEMEDMLARDEELALALTRLSMEEASTCYQNLLNEVQHNARQRIAFLLTGLHDRASALDPRPDHELPLTEKELAQAAGLSQVHTCRVVRQLDREGLIAFSSRHIRIRDPDALAQALTT